MYHEAITGQSCSLLYTFRVSISRFDRPAIDNCISDELLHCYEQIRVISKSELTCLVVAYFLHYGTPWAGFVLARVGFGAQVGAVGAEGWGPKDGGGNAVYDYRPNDYNYWCIRVRIH